MGAQANPMRQEKPALNDPAGDGGQRDGRSRVRLAIVAVSAVAVLAAGAGILYAVFAPSSADTVAAGKADSIFTSAYSGDAARGYDDFNGTGPRPMPVCGDGPGENCVIDGETFWLSGRKIRLADIDAPNDKARCPAEAARARDAADTLAALLDRQPIEIRAKGRDRYGRLLAAIKTPEGDVGRNLVRFKVAVPWYGGKEPDTDWCG